MASKQKKAEFAEIKPGDVEAGMQIRVHQKIKDVSAKGEDRERIQIFEGMVIYRRHGNEPGATFTVRKTSEGIGVEKTFPIHSPSLAKIELVGQKKVRRAQLYFLKRQLTHLKTADVKKKESVAK